MLKIPLALLLVASVTALVVILHQERHRANVRAILQIRDTLIESPTVSTLGNTVSKYAGKVQLQPVSGKEWDLVSRAEFGATNWILVLELSECQLVAIAIRTEDSRRALPAGAPYDWRETVGPARRAP